MAPTAICSEEEQEGSLLHQTFLLDEEYKVTSVFVALLGLFLILARAK
jgi:hypothetical protein